MAFPTVIAKNTTGTDIFLPRLGETVPAVSQITLTENNTYFEICSEEVLPTKINAGHIVINDGISDLSIAEALGYLDASGNLNGPVTGSTAGALVRLLDATGRFTEVAETKLYDPAAVDPAVPAPADGDMYYNTVLEMWMCYDEGRGKWLSFEGDTFQVGQNGNVPVGTYYKGVAGKTLSDVLGYTAPYNGTVITLTFTQADADDTDFEVMASGVQIGAVNTGGLTKGFDNTIDFDFSQGDILAVRNDAAGVGTRDVQCWIRMKWRA